MAYKVFKSNTIPKLENEKEIMGKEADRNIPPQKDYVKKPWEEEEDKKLTEVLLVYGFDYDEI